VTRVIDITGKVYGRLTVLHRAGSDREGKATWAVRCECGTEKVVRGKHLRLGSILSCGCLCAEIVSGLRKRNLKGQKFGRLLALESTDRRLRGCIVWRFKCDCGKEVDLPSHSVATGNTKSCGCLQPEVASANNLTHGMSRTGTHRAWANMLSRCNNEKTEFYPRYGGRGITVCDRWKTFENFLSDMGVKPEGRYSIERLNNDGNYEPSNCVWASDLDQSLNKSSTVFVTYFGEKYPLRIACVISGVSYTGVIESRYKNGTTHQDEFDRLLHKLRKL